MSKPFLKCIDAKYLREWVDEKARRRINLHTAWSIIRSQYCAAVVARGVCPIDCENCREEIVSLFRLEQAENPEALLTWLAKDHSTRFIEKQIAAEKAGEQFPALESAEELYAQLFPKRGEDDLFAQLMKEYDG